MMGTSKTDAAHAHSNAALCEKNCRSLTDRMARWRDGATDDTSDELLREAVEEINALMEARRAERERLVGYFRQALASPGVTWPGEVEILYDKCFGAPYVPDEDA